MKSYYRCSAVMIFLVNYFWCNRYRNVFYHENRKQKRKEKVTVIGTCVDKMIRSLQQTFSIVPGVKLNVHPIGTQDLETVKVIATNSFHVVRYTRKLYIGRASQDIHHSHGFFLRLFFQPTALVMWGKYYIVLNYGKVVVYLQKYCRYYQAFRYSTSTTAKEQVSNVKLTHSAKHTYYRLETSLASSKSLSNFLRSNQSRVDLLFSRYF